MRNVSGTCDRVVKGHQGFVEGVSIPDAADIAEMGDVLQAFDVVMMQTNPFIHDLLHDRGVPGWLLSKASTLLTTQSYCPKVLALSHHHRR